MYVCNMSTENVSKILLQQCSVEKYGELYIKQSTALSQGFYTRNITYICIRSLIVVWLFGTRIVDS